MTETSRGPVLTTFAVLFVILAAVMYLTRGIDWDAFGAHTSKRGS